MVRHSPHPAGWPDELVLFFEIILACSLFLAFVIALLLATPKTLGKVGRRRGRWLLLGLLLWVVFSCFLLGQLGPDEGSSESSWNGPNTLLNRIRSWLGW